jgi:hypothetical protein
MEGELGADCAKAALPRASEPTSPLGAAGRAEAHTD